VEAMLGKAIQMEVNELTEHRGEQVALELSGIQLLPRSAPIDLALRYGEVTGVIGLIGAGKTELAQAIFGAERLRAGSMRLDGAEFAPRSTRDAVRRGIYLAPEDRVAQAMLPGWTVATTGSLPFLGKISRWSVTNPRAERRMAADII